MERMEVLLFGAEAAAFVERCSHPILIESEVYHWQERGQFTDFASDLDAVLSWCRPPQMETVNSRAENPKGNGDFDLALH